MTPDESGWALRRADAAATIPHIWASRNGDARPDAHVGGDERMNSKLKPKLTLHDVAERGRTIDAEAEKGVISTPRRYGPEKSRSTKREQVS